MKVARYEIIVRYTKDNAVPMIAATPRVGRVSGAWWRASLPIGPGEHGCSVFAVFRMDEVPHCPGELVSMQMRYIRGWTDGRRFSFLRSLAAPRPRNPSSPLSLSVLGVARWILLLCLREDAFITSLFFSDCCRESDGRVRAPQVLKGAFLTEFRPSIDGFSLRTGVYHDFIPRRPPRR